MEYVPGGELFDYIVHNGKVCLISSFPFNSTSPQVYLFSLSYIIYNLVHKYEIILCHLFSIFIINML